MIFISRYEGNSNTTCLKRFPKINVLKKDLYPNFTVACLDIPQNDLFEFNWCESSRLYKILFLSAADEFPS